MIRSLVADPWPLDNTRLEAVAGALCARRWCAVGAMPCEVSDKGGLVSNSEVINHEVLLRRVVETGATIQRFELVQPSLHQIFLEKVGATGVEEGMSGQG